MTSFFLKNFKIETKLFLGSMIMVGIAFGIMALGQFGLSLVNRQVRLMVEDRLIPMREFTKLKADLMESRAILVAMIYETSVEKQKISGQQLQTIAAQIDSVLTRHLNSSKRSRVQQEKLVEIQKTWNEFRTTRDQEIIPFIFQGNREAAAYLALGIQAERFKKFTEDSNLLLERVQEEAARGKQEAEQTVSSLQKIAVGLSLVGILLSAFFNLVVAKNITEPLSKVVLLARDLGEGRLGSRLEIDSKDEVGKMAEALNLALERLSRDIEEQKRLEAMLQQSEKISAIGQLAAGVAHEMNNPLGVILGFSQAIIKRLPPGNSWEGPLKSIEREALRCKQLVQDLLTFSRSGKGQKEEIDLNHAIESALALIQSQIRIKNIHLIKEMGVNFPKIFANSTQMQQIVINLCQNAIEAMPQGGRLTVRTQKEQRDHKDYLKMEIRDTGRGIPRDIQSKIFDPFFTTKEVGQGTGLGLALVYEIVHKHNGTLEVESEIGKGTQFFVWLPALK